MTIRDEGFVRNTAVSIARGIQLGGTKDIPGLWTEQTEGARFRMRVMDARKNLYRAENVDAAQQGKRPPLSDDFRGTSPLPLTLGANLRKGTPPDAYSFY